MIDQRGVQGIRAGEEWLERTARHLTEQGHEAVFASMGVPERAEDALKEALRLDPALADEAQRAKAIGRERGADAVKVLSSDL